MKKSLILLALAQILFCGMLLSQHHISGRVIDSATREPLAGASVFCQNTTLGTTSNRQGEFNLDLKPGGYDLIISYTGYQRKEMRINSSDGNLADIELVKEEKSLGEVIITSSNEVKDGWVKYGDFFVDHFIGTTPNAEDFVLKNPEVLKFYYLKRSNRLRVLATEPLQMENHALGYNLLYQLDTFIYNYNDDINSYRGFCLFSEMEGSDSLKRIWHRNRRNAYFGSKLHFLRSYYDSAVSEEGFLVDLLDEEDPERFNKVANLYDSAYYGVLDSTAEVEIWYPRLLRVSYTRERPHPSFLEKFNFPKDVLIQISYIQLLNAIAIRENGYFYYQRDWINQGYWSWENLADMLPYDYAP